MNEIVKKHILILLIGIVSLIIQFPAALFLHRVADFHDVILQAIFLVTSSFIAIIIPILIIDPKVFKNNYFKRMITFPLIFVILVLMILQIYPYIIPFNFPFHPTYLFFPVFLIFERFEPDPIIAILFIIPLLHLLIVSLAPYLLSKYVQKSKNRLVRILSLILYTYANWAIAGNMFSIMYTLANFE